MNKIIQEAAGQMDLVNPGTRGRRDANGGAIHEGRPPKMFPSSLNFFLCCTLSEKRLNEFAELQN